MKNIKNLYVLLKKFFYLKNFIILKKIKNMDTKKTLIFSDATNKKLSNILKIKKLLRTKSLTNGLIINIKFRNQKIIL